LHELCHIREHRQARSLTLSAGGAPANSSIQRAPLPEDRALTALAAADEQRIQAIGKSQGPAQRLCRVLQGQSPISMAAARWFAIIISLLAGFPKYHHGTSQSFGNG
jgi:hypothetical protein